MEKTEYFVYCGFFMAHLWGKRFAHIPKGEFFEVPNTLFMLRALTRKNADGMIQKIQEKGVNFMLNMIYRNQKYGRSFAPSGFVD